MVYEYECEQELYRAIVLVVVFILKQKAVNECLRGPLGLVIGKKRRVLSRHDLGIPPTAFVRDRRSVLHAIDQVGGAPVTVSYTHLTLPTSDLV